MAPFSLAFHHLLTQKLTHILPVIMNSYSCITQIKSEFLPDVETSSSQLLLSIPLPDYCRHSLDATENFSIVGHSYSLGDIWLHQVSPCLPPPSYAVSLSHTQYIGRNVTKSITAVCWWSIYPPKVYFPVSLISLSYPSLFHVPSHCRCAVFHMTWWRNSTWTPSSLFSIVAKITHVSDQNSITAWKTTPWRMVNQKGYPLPSFLTSFLMRT